MQIAEFEPAKADASLANSRNSIRMHLSGILRYGHPDIIMGAMA